MLKSFLLISLSTNRSSEGREGFLLNLSGIKLSILEEVTVIKVGAKGFKDCKGRWRT